MNRLSGAALRGVHISGIGLAWLQRKVKPNDSETMLAVITTLSLSLPLLAIKIKRCCVHQRVLCSVRLQNDLSQTKGSFVQIGVGYSKTGGNNNIAKDSDGLPHPRFLLFPVPL